VAAVLDSLTPLVRLLGQADDPAETATRLRTIAAAGGSGRALAESLGARVADRGLVGPTLTYAGVLGEDGSVAAEALVRLGQVEVLLEAAERVWAPGWDLVLTVPGFLRPSLAELVAEHGDGSRPRDTGQVLAEVAAAATSRLVVAAPFLHTAFVAKLAPAVERLLSDGGEVVVITRALSLATANRSSANVDAVALLREAGVRSGRTVTVRSWEEGSLGVHFKVLLADESLAYLGSANLTPAGAAGHAEAGVLLRGDTVTTLASWLRLVADELGRRALPSA
jgi:hypothetical protein